MSGAVVDADMIDWTARPWHRGRAGGRSRSLSGPCGCTLLAMMTKRIALVGALALVMLTGCSATDAPAGSAPAPGSCLDALASADEIRSIAADYVKLTTEENEILTSHFEGAVSKQDLGDALGVIANGVEPLVPKMRAAAGRYDEASVACRATSK